MFFSDQITLRSVIYTKDADSYPIEVPTDTVVWANRKSVTRSEFYASNQAGINMTIAFDIHSEDWNNQTQLLDGTKVYKIERSYQKGLGIVELNCSDMRA